MGDIPNQNNGRTSANNLDDGISRLDRTLNKIYLPEIMAARRVIHSRMRKKKERQMAGAPRGGPSLYDYIMESRRRKGGNQSVSLGEHEPLHDVPEDDEKREHHPPTRQDSSFQSVDLSEIAGLREDPNRTPTPQPTFTDRPGPERRDPQPDRSAEAVVALGTVSEKTQGNSRSSSGNSSTRSEVISHEHYELQVKPGYADAQQIEMATAAWRVNEQSRVQRRNSFESKTQRLVELRQDSTASDPGQAREKTVKKKQQTRQANDLDLAQKIILKRKVEEYIDRQEPEVTMDEVAESRETAWVEQAEVTEESSQRKKQSGRESIQTVVSHRSDSAGSPAVLREDKTEDAFSGNVPQRPESDPSGRSDSGANSRPSTAGSDLNPHPLLPAIGTPPVPADTPTDEEQEPRQNNDAPVAAAVTAGVVAAGAGTAAAVAIKANKSDDKPKKSKSPENAKAKKDKKHTAKAAKASENNKPKVKAPKEDAESGQAPTQPAEKKGKPKDNKKPLSLIDMSPGDVKSTIDALEKMVDANIQGVIDNTKGKKSKSKAPEEDRQMMKAVMNPAFQAEINSFLAQT